MAIDRTGISSLKSGAPEIKYTGDEGPKSPTVKEMEMAGMMDQISVAFEIEHGYDISLANPEMREEFIQKWKEENFYGEGELGRSPVQSRESIQMAMADPLLEEQYQQYVFEMQEQGLQPMSFEEFVAQARAGMNKGGIARVGFKGGGADAGTESFAKSLGGQSYADEVGSKYGFSGGDGGGDRHRTASEVRAEISNRTEEEKRRIREEEEKRKELIESRKQQDDGFFRNTERKLINNFVRRNKYKNLIDSGIYSDFPGLYAKILGYMNPNEEVDDFDIDSIREMVATIYSGGGDLTPKQLRGLEGLRKDFEFEKNYPNATTKELREYYNLDDKITGGGDGPPPIIYPYPTSTAMAPAVVPPVVPPVETANPFLPGSNLPFANYGTAAHGAQFGVDPRMFVADGGRIGYAGGGIADLRQGYFLGKLVKKIGRGIKKVAKSPLGKAALAFGAYKLGGGLFGKNKFFGTGFNPLKTMTKIGPMSSPFGKLLSKAGMADFVTGDLTKRGIFGGIAALSTLPLLFGQSQEEEEGMKYADLPNIFDKYSPDELRARALRGELPQDEYPFQSYYAADGGRVGLMNGGNPRFAALNKLYNINDEEEFSQGGSAGLPPITAGIEGQASQSFSDDETPAPTQPDQMPMPRPMMNPMMAGRMNPMMARGMMPRMMAQEGGLMDQENMLMAGGGLRGEKAQEIAEIMAEEQYGMEFYDLPLKKQMEVYQLALDMYDSGGMATGGRVAAQEGGIMQMASGKGAQYYADLYMRYAQDMINDGNKPMPIEDFVEIIKETERTKEAKGGRIGAQEGGMMDMGGMEKDYRNEGGFVPIGGQERADDVPARLSKNEFVFTADAVRAAGGGDIDKGAEVMENMMENLEKGGKVSEESQGLKGARDMFATAQRLEGVL
jgi:hypothetical protein